MTGAKKLMIRMIIPLMLVAIVGCSNKSPVTGKVVFSDGTPVPLVTVIFESEDGLTSAVGKTDTEGSYELSFETANDGVPPGRYRVAITPPEGITLSEEDKQLSPGPGWGIKAKYRMPTTSELAFDVQEGSNEITIELGDRSGGKSDQDVLQQLGDQEDPEADIYKGEPSDE
jgi:hypothetical protein